MRVTVVRSGGVAGMVRTTTLDTAEMPDDAAAGLRDAVSACSFTAPPAPTATAVRDGFAYEVTVAHDDGAEQRVRFHQGGAPAGVDALLGRVDDCPHGRHALGR